MNCGPANHAALIFLPITSWHPHRWGSRPEYFSRSLSFDQGTFGAAAKVWKLFGETSMGNGWGAGDPNFFWLPSKSSQMFFFSAQTLEACRIFETNIRMSGESSKFCKDFYFSSIFTWWFAFLRDETVLFVATYVSCDRFLSGNFRMAASYEGLAVSPMIFVLELICFMREVLLKIGGFFLAHRSGDRLIPLASPFEWVDRGIWRMWAPRKV